MTAPGPSPSQSNALSAQALIEVRELLDRQLSPLGLEAIRVLSPHPGEFILDIGCGTGETVIQLADAVGPSGRVVGVDISLLVLEEARGRAAGRENVGFIQRDAGALELADGTVDAIFSRFGVMAITSPVAAFSAFRRILKTNGRLAFVCWRSLAENEVDIFPLRAAGLEHLADPTPFSFEDPIYVRHVLAKAGFRDIAIAAYDLSVSSGGLDAMVTVLTTVWAE